MNSRWYELKPAAIVMRKNGKSITLIEESLGIPRSTLSGWFKDVQLTDQQKSKLSEARLTSLAKARLLASAIHREQKQSRINEASKAAQETLALIQCSPAIIELALAMLYWGEGRKSASTALGASDVEMLKFFLAALNLCYGINSSDVGIWLHLRQDQDDKKEKEYWSNELDIPIENFHRSSFDKRTKGSTYPGYHGVCLIHCANIAVQRKLLFLYKSFCKQVLGGESGD